MPVSCRSAAADDQRPLSPLAKDGTRPKAARRKLFDLHANNQSQISGLPLATIQKLYQVEREVADLSPDERRRICQEQAKPILDERHDWLSRHRLQVSNGSSTAKAIDYSLKCWTALAHYLGDGQVPIDNNWIEDRIRPITTGRKNWLFAGSLRAGKQAAAIMSLIQSAKLNGNDPYLYLKDTIIQGNRMTAITGITGTIHAPLPQVGQAIPRRVLGPIQSVLQRA